MLYCEMSKGSLSRAWLEEFRVLIFVSDIELPHLILDKVPVHSLSMFALLIKRSTL